MSASIRAACGLLAPGILALALASTGAAQQRVSHPELDDAHDQAMELAYEWGADNLQRAVWSHGHVAYLRPADDVERFECLRTQANLLKAIGETDGARYYLELAARHAEDVGDDYDAAMAYIDAGLVALEARDATRAWQNAESAATLASNGRMEAVQRREVRNRLGLR